MSPNKKLSVWVTLIATVTLSTILLAMVSGCGYDGDFRYPCQNPKNWKNEDCQKPFCEATGTCPDQLTKRNQTNNP